MARSPVVDLKQTVTLHGKPRVPQTPHDSSEPLAVRFEFPLTAKRAPAGEVVAIVKEFALPSIRLDLVDSGLAGLWYREDAVTLYKADVSLEAIKNDPKKYPFQATTLRAIEAIRKLWSGVHGVEGGLQLRDDFKAPVNKLLKDDIKREQDFLSMRLAELGLLDAELDTLLTERPKQSKRWQANYDFTRAAIKARLAFMNEYRTLLGEVLTEMLPKLDAKLGEDTYKLTSSEKMRSKKDVQTIADESRKLYEQLIADHKGTPWAIQAKREKFFSLGLEWKPTNSEPGIP